VGTGALGLCAGGRQGLPHDCIPARVARRIPPPRGVKARRLGETFDFVFCLGILHRVTDPLGSLRLLRARLADGGRVLLETYGVNHEDGSSSYIRLHRPGDVYSGDEFVYWGFGAEALRRLAEAGFTGFQLHATPISTDTHALSHRSHSPRTTLLSQRLASDTGIIRRQTSWLVIQSRQAMRSPTTG